MAKRGIPTSNSRSQGDTIDPVPGLAEHFLRRLLEGPLRGRQWASRFPSLRAGSALVLLESTPAAPANAAQPRLFEMALAVVQRKGAGPSRSLNDSPWQEAILAGDALKFGDTFCNYPAATLPNGLGVHDNFEDEDCLSPWLKLTAAQYLVDGSVDADDGHLGETPQGDSLGGVFRPATQSIGIMLEFIPHKRGRLSLLVRFCGDSVRPISTRRNDANSRLKQHCPRFIQSLFGRWPLFGQ